MITPGDLLDNASGTVDVSRCTSAATSRLLCTTKTNPTDKRSVCSVALCTVHKVSTTSCACGDTVWLHPCKLTISSHLFARWHLFRHVGYLRHQQQVDLWPFDLESGVRVTGDVAYLCANFSLPMPLCSRLRPDVRDRLPAHGPTVARMAVLFSSFTHHLSSLLTTWAKLDTSASQDRHVISA